jgi:hypothetical protein
MAAVAPKLGKIERELGRGRMRGNEGEMVCSSSERSLLW